MTSATAASRGRPRSADRTTAILEATADLLREQGYDHLRMQDVAERSGSGLATIYRRWSTKQDLIAEAITFKPILEYEPTGDPRTDLIGFIEAMASDFNDQRHFLPGMMVAAREHPQILEAMRGEVAATVRRMVEDLVVQHRGAAPTRLDLLVDAIPGVLMLRAGMLDEDVDPAAYARDMVALIESAG